MAQSTVATALGDQHEGKLQPETVRRIREEAEKMGYRPLRSAQIMRNGRSHTVGLATQSGFTTMNESVRDLSIALGRAGYRIVQADTEWFGNGAEGVKDYLLDHSVECVILCGMEPSTDPQWTEAFLRRSIPIVILRGAPDENIVSVRSDLRAAYYQMTRHHLALGSRRLALCCGYRDPGWRGPVAWPIQDRVDGFMQAIREAGGIVKMDDETRECLRLPGCDEVSTASIVGEINYVRKEPFINDIYEYGYHEVQQWIRSDSLPDSLICCNDDNAIAATAACIDAGISVPGRVRVSGCDDIRTGSYNAIPLTTISQPGVAMVEKVVSIAVRLLDEGRCEEPKGAVVLLPCEVIIRRSTCTKAEAVRQSKLKMFKPAADGTTFLWRPDGDRAVHADRLRH